MHVIVATAVAESVGLNVCLIVSFIIDSLAVVVVLTAAITGRDITTTLLDYFAVASGETRASVRSPRPATVGGAVVVVVVGVLAIVVRPTERVERPLKHLGGAHSFLGEILSMVQHDCHRQIGLLDEVSDLLGEQWRRRSAQRTRRDVRDAPAALGQRTSHSLRDSSQRLGQRETDYQLLVNADPSSTPFYPVGNTALVNGTTTFPVSVSH